MRVTHALPRTLLLLIALAAAGSNIRAAEINSSDAVNGTTTEVEVSGSRVMVHVKAMVGKAVVSFNEGDCPDVIHVVATGKTAETDPTTCTVVIKTTTERSTVDALVWAIANAEDDETIEALIAQLSEAEQVMVIVVLTNNAAQLGINDGIINDTVNRIGRASPGGVPASIPIFLQFTAPTTGSDDEEPDGGPDEQPPPTVEDIPPADEDTPPPPDVKPPTDTTTPPGGAIGDPPSPE